MTLPPLSGPEDPELAGLLRDVLHREAARTQPGADGLARIRARIAEEHPRPMDGLPGGTRSRGYLPGLTDRVDILGGRHSRLLARLVPAVAAAAVLLVGGAAGVALNALRPAPSQHTAGTNEIGATSASATTRTTPSGTTTPTVPIYWLGGPAVRGIESSGTATGTTTGSPAAAGSSSLWLYREFVPIPEGREASTQLAIELMLDGVPADPDYTNLWAPGTVTVTVVPRLITVDLSPAAFSHPAMTRSLAEAAVQQLVYTATAAAKDLTGSGAKVQVLVDGASGYLAWGVLHLDGPLVRDTSAQAPVWVISPQEGQEVAAGQVTVSGVGPAGSAPLRWTIARLDPSDTTRATGADGGSTNTSSAGATSTGSRIVAGGTVVPLPGQPRPSFTVTADLTPGTYQVTVWRTGTGGTSDPAIEAGNTPGPGATPDSKVFVVR